MGSEAVKDNGLSSDPSMIETVSGMMVSLLEPRASTIDLNDIVDSLSVLPRFNGHAVTEGFAYSVGQHCLECFELARDVQPFAKELCALCLMHDFHEAYLGDLSRPLIRTITNEQALRLSYERVFSQDFLFDRVLHDLKERFDARIRDQCGLGHVDMDKWRESVAAIDDLQLRREMLTFLPSRGHSVCWPSSIGHFPIRPVTEVFGPELTSVKLGRALEELESWGFSVNWKMGDVSSGSGSSNNTEVDQNAGDQT